MTYVRLNLLLLSLLIAGSRIAVILHELVGHSLFGLFFGIRTLWFRVRPFGGGEVRFEYVPPEARSFLPEMGGILVNLLVGAVCLFLARRYREKSRLYIVLLVFGGINLVGGLAYWTLGSFYRWGDPTRYPNHWMVVLPIAPVAVYFCVRWFLEIRPGERKPVFLALTLVPVGLIYAGLYQIKGDRLAAVEAHNVAVEREVKKVAKERNIPPAEVKPQEVKKPFPMLLLFSGLCLLAAGLAGIRPAPRRDLPLRWPFLSVTGGIAVGFFAVVWFWLNNGVSLG